MKTIFHAMEPKILDQFIETKRELLEIASSMSAKDRAEGRKEIMEAATLFEVPADLENPRELYTVTPDGVAIIPISGKLTSEADICDGFFSDCTTYGFISTAAIAADSDPSVEKIQFNISSGGGHVTGVDACGQVMAGLKKPTEGVVFGMAASAAYWLGCQADSLRASSPTDFFGSIGVAVEIVDMRKAEESRGVRRIVLTSTDAPDKRLDMATEEGQEKMIGELDAIHEVFAARVASGRGVSIEKINADFGQGGVLIAAKAKAAGMIDSIDNDISNVSRTNNPPASAGQPKVEVQKMATLKELLAADPNAQAEYDSNINTARAEGATAGKEEGMEQMNKAFAAAIPIMSSDAYPESVKERVSAKAQAGDIEGLKDFVAIHDMTIESQNTTVVDGEQVIETPATQQSDAEKSEADFQARMGNKGGAK